MHIYGGREGKRELERDRERYILRNWLTQLWWLTRSISVGWVGGLETKGRVSVAVQIQRLSAGRIPLAWGKLVFCSIQAIN